MISIDEVFVDSVATNLDAASNGRDLLKKGKLAKLSVDEDETLLFGECAGSGKTPYVTSIDFVDPSNPVYRCTCPSRQFPCKHALGIMYAWARKHKFTVAPAPADVLEKRTKSVERAEKKK